MRRLCTFTPHQSYSNDIMQKNVVGGVCCTHGTQIDAYNIVVEPLKERHNPDRSRHRRNGSYTYGMKVHGLDSPGSEQEKMIGYFDHYNKTSHSIICVQFSHWQRNCQLVEDFTPCIWLVNIQNVAFGHPFVMCGYQTRRGSSVKTIPLTISYCERYCLIDTK